MTIETRQEGDVLYVTLNRPDKLNAVDEQMATELLDAFSSVATSHARALVLNGNGRGFSAGRDLADAEPLTEDAASILSETFNPLFAALRAIDIPTVAAVSGPALGVGLGLSLACDITIVATNAKIGSPFANIGAVLDSGGHFHLVNRIGAHRAMELIYTGRLLSGAEAAEIGLVNRAVPPDDLQREVSELASAIASGPTAAFALSKKIVRQIEEHSSTFDGVLEREAAAQGSASNTLDYAEGIGAFQEKRSATFQGK